MTDFVKLVDNRIERAPMNFTTEDGRTICNFNLSEELMRENGFKPLVKGTREPGKEYEVSYEEQEDSIVEILTEIIPDPEEEARKERERLDMLKLTPSDVERALYYGLGMDFDDLKAMIASVAPSVDLKGLAIEFRANDFYRGAKDKSGQRLVDMIGLLLGLTTAELDYLFEHKELSQEAINRVAPVIQATLAALSTEPEPTEEPEPEGEEEPEPEGEKEPVEETTENLEPAEEPEGEEEPEE